MFFQQIFRLKLLSVAQCPRWRAPRGGRSSRFLRRSRLSLNSRQLKRRRLGPDLWTKAGFHMEHR
jgi:hypothetical protein